VERPVERTELQAAIEARRELGEQMEPHIVDAFVERIERRLGEHRTHISRRDRVREGSFILAIVSLGCAIPITAIAATQAGLVGLVVVWIGIVVVNAVYNR
jgi:dolichol kinase